ncbi:hypothetical protein BGW80DRAFT_1167072, partial [Lactifluus volemus]
PYWMSHTFEDLETKDGPSEWKKVLQQWVTLERVLKFPSGKVSYTISRKHRPDHINTWIQSGQEVVPPIKNIAMFSWSWKQWWATLQPPQQRDDNTSKLKRLALGIDSWADLRKGEVNSFYSIISGLSWWLQAIDDSDANQLQDFTETLDDVSWALEQMVHSVGGKRSRKRSCVQSSAVPVKRSKRYVQ